MAQLNIKAPDGKALSIQIPDGTDPSKYDSMVDDVIQHYQSTMPDLSHDPSNPESGEFERSPNYPPEGVTTLAPSLEVAMAPGMVKGAAELGLAGGKLAAQGIARGLSGVGEAAGDVAGDVLSNLKSKLPNPSLKGLGYTPSQVGTEAGQALAQGARDYATTAQPEIGELVAKAGQPNPKTMDLVTRAANDEMAEPIQAPLSQTNTDIFNQPIAQGMSRSASEMRDLTTEQWKQAGDAISRTLKGLDATGEQFDPQPVLQKINSMFIKDADGELMTTGVQGETNDALKDAVASLNDYSKGQPITYEDANRIKSMLQDSANYASKRFEESNEAYKQAASLIKEGIDDQAGAVLQKNGGDIENFQKLRGAYGKLSSLKQSLNAQTGRELLQPSFAETVLNAGKKLLPYATVGGLVAKGASEVLH